MTPNDSQHDAINRGRPASTLAIPSADRHRPWLGIVTHGANGGYPTKYLQEDGVNVGYYVYKPNYDVVPVERARQGKTAVFHPLEMDTIISVYTTLQLRSQVYTYVYKTLDPFDVFRPGSMTPYAMLPPTPYPYSDAQTDTWAIGDPPNQRDGVDMIVQTRSHGDGETFYAYYRTLTFGTDGRLLFISAERRYPA